jgi:hypothetical protein
VVFRADPQLVAQASSTVSTLSPNSQVAYSPPMEEGQAKNGDAGTQHAPPKNLTAVVIPALSLPANITLIKCPPGTVNISGLCKRSKF